MTATRDNAAEILALRYLLAYNREDGDALVAVTKDLAQGQHHPVEIVAHMADIAVGYARMVGAFLHGDADYHSADGAAQLIERDMQRVLDRPADGEETSP